MYNFYDKQLDSKILILSKGAGCKYCTQLNMFMDMALDKEYNDKVVKILEDEDKEFYDRVVAGEQFMQAPMMINLETGEKLSGFDPSQVIKMLQSA